MSSLKLLGIIGTGTIGVLVAGYFASVALKTGTDGAFLALIAVFVVAGALGYVLKNVR